MPLAEVLPGTGTVNALSNPAGNAAENRSSEPNAPASSELHR